MHNGDLCLVGVAQSWLHNDRVITDECKYCNVICTRPPPHTIEHKAACSSLLSPVLKLGLSQLWTWLVRWMDGLMVLYKAGLAM